MIWDQDHVRLPSSVDSQFAEIARNGQKVLKQRWSLIEESLLQKISNSRDLERAIKSYNTRYEEIWNFVTLHELFEVHFSPQESRQFFNEHLPKLISLALQLPHLIRCPIPLLKRDRSKSISMSQQQAACLLANAFLCTFPRRNTDKKNSEYANYPDINFNKLFSKSGQKVIEKLKCIINYFLRVLDKMPTNIITFQRRSMDVQVDWEDSSVKLSRTKFLVKANGRIEQGDGMLQVDFANHLVGGGVLGRGCVQEEIRFVINPEMIVARLFTESLRHQEVLIMIGCEQFSSYTGYSSHFRWVGDFVDTTPLDIYRRKKCRVVAIDALSYKNSYEQFKETNFSRDLKKAYVGFYSEGLNDRSPVASGLWGCGAFNGHAIRSVLIQLMACSLAQRNIVLFTFGDSFVRNEIIDIYTFLEEKDVTVGQLYKLLRRYRYDGHPNDPNQLIPFIKKQYASVIASNSFKPNVNVIKQVANCSSSSEVNYERDDEAQLKLSGAGTSKSSVKNKTVVQTSLSSFWSQISNPSSDTNNERDSSPISVFFNPEKSLNPSKDQQRFNEISNRFEQCKKKPEKPSLLECLDSAMDEMSKKP